MSDRLHVGSRKGLFTLARRNGGWAVDDVQFLGDPVTMTLADGDAEYAALDLGHFGAKLWRKRGNAPWQEIAVPSFPAKPDDPEDPHPWTLGKIWALEPGGVPGRLWAGTMPGGLFRSDDGGDSWTLNEPLWRHPDRKKWMGVAGGEQPGMHSVLVDPRDPRTIRVGVSCAGMWETRDEGASWAIINEGMYNEYLPPEQSGDPIAQDIHLLDQCDGAPDVVWCQHHNGVFRSTDAGHHWTEIKATQPSKFGFAVAAHPSDPKTAWFVPAVKDEKRIPVDGRLVVSRTRDAGESFEVLSNGLPQRHAYDLIYRHGLAIDGSGERLAIGSTSGGVWISEDGGDSWSAPEGRLPPVSSVRFAA
ncbi:MAG: WD40/YVTN/BNR-like repeat-containing protein [Alphaproteobacteria bacterium]